MLKKLILIPVCSAMLFAPTIAQDIEPELTTKNPLQMVLMDNEQYLMSDELSDIEIKQTLIDSVENPALVKIVLVQSNLLDDSVSSIRNTYEFKKSDQEWKLEQKETDYLCLRGENTTNFQSNLCP